MKFFIDILTCLVMIITISFFSINLLESKNQITVRALNQESSIKDGMFITINSTPNAVIVEPKNGTLRERFAAKEIQKYIQKISGATLPIISDFELIKSGRKFVSHNLILIGGPEKNLKTAHLITQKQFDDLVSGPEGIFIKSFSISRAIVIAGSSKNPFEYERGTIYAAYEFLEKYLGCSFVSYGLPNMEIGEYIPTVPSIKIGDVSYFKNRADNIYRTAILQYYNTTISPDHGLNLQFIDWAAKSRYNRILTMESIYTAFKKNGVFEEAQKRGILFTVGHHESSRLFLPPDGNDLFKESYYTTHPEYYRLQKDGTRLYNKSAWRDSWIFCSRNKSAIRQFADNVKAWLALNLYVDTLSIWANDLTAPQCTDALCAKYSKVENYAYFVNEVAKQVTALYPNVKIDMLAYSNLFSCPENIRLEPSVVVDESTWGNSGLRYVGKEDGSSLIGTPYEINAKKWHNAGATVVFYEYFMGNFGAKQKYIPMADEMQAIFRYFKDSGYYQGSGTQIEVFNIWNCLFNFYTHGRTSYDTALSMEDNLDRFCKIFGAGAPFIKSYIQYVEHIIDGQVRYDEAGSYLALNADKTKIYDLFEKAYNAESKKRLRDNIRMMRMAFRYSDLSTNGGNDGELKYIYDNFDSYSHNPGYGIYIAVTETFDSKNRAIDQYKPDKWYLF
ncbi:MAG: DUF4838 domain-containing protein [Desulfamplus sp.]|nr:DUF4838 domain-containing protein [Desulfamplus sp.]